MSTEEWTFLATSADISPGVNYSTLISEFEDGAEQRRQKVENARHSFDLSYASMDNTQRLSMLNFFKARKGAFDNFYYEFPGDSPTTNEFLGAGTTTTYTLANKPIRADTQTISVDGVVQTEGVEYTINDTTGVITFGTPPGGSTVQADTYRWFYVVRFADDALSFKSIYRDDVYSLDLSFVQDPGA